MSVQFVKLIVYQVAIKWSNSLESTCHKHETVADIVCHLAVHNSSSSDTHFIFLVTDFTKCLVISTCKMSIYSIFVGFQDSVHKRLIIK